MSRSIQLVLPFVLATALFAQHSSVSQPYEPAVPPPSVGAYGPGIGYGYYGGAGTTAAGSSMTGMANVISAKGDYNLSTSAAAVNMTQAEKQEIQNRQDYTNTYFEMRETNRQAREAERGSRPTPEQLARIAHEYAPQRLSPGELNDVTGVVNWPTALQSDDFAEQRASLEQLLGSYSQLGALKQHEKARAREAINSIYKSLKAQIRDIPGPDYISSRKFLESLMFTTCNCRLG